MKKVIHFLFGAALLLIATAQCIHAQANLSFQSILKKANGLAVDDGNYRPYLYALQRRDGPHVAYSPGIRLLFLYLRSN